LRNCFLSLLLLSNLLFAEAFAGGSSDSTCSSFDISALYHYGFIIAHRASIVALQKDHTKAFELTFRQTHQR